MKDADDDLRATIVSALGEIGDASVVDALVGALKDKNATIRSSRAAALGEIGDAKATRRAGRGAEGRRSRRPARRGRRHRRDRRRRPASSPASTSAAGDRRASGGAVMKAARRRGVRVVALARAEGRQRRGRRSCLCRSGRAHPRRVRSARAGQRGRAVHAAVWPPCSTMARRSIPPSAASAPGAFRGDEDMTTSRRAGGRRARRDRRTSAAGAAQGAQRPAWVARRNAAWGLGALDASEAVPALIDALKDTDAGVREQVAWALGAIGDRRAVDGLVGALGDTVAGVRRQAAWALGAIGDRRAVGGLTSVEGRRRRRAQAGGVGAGRHRRK